MSEIFSWVGTVLATIWGAFSWAYWAIDTLVFSLPILGPFIQVAFWIALAFAGYRYSPHWLRPVFAWVASKLRWIFAPIIDFIWQPVQRAIIRRATGVDVGASETEKDHLIQQLKRQIDDKERQITALKARRPRANTANKLTVANRFKWMGIGGVIVGTSRWWGPVVWPVIQRVPTMFG